MGNYYYIRLGEIPENGKSGIYKGDEGKIGEEKGVSVFYAVKIYGFYRLILPRIKSCSTQYTIEGLIQDVEEGKRKIYLVDGDLCGFGSDSEPLLINCIIKRELQIKDYQIIDIEPEIGKLPNYLMRKKKIFYQEKWDLKTRDGF